jgi:phospholipid-translocating ATPase
MFNTLFTSLPVIFLGCFDKDLAPSTLLAVPELYSVGREHRGFNFKLYAWWAGTGAAEAVIVYFIVYGIFGEAIFAKDNKLFAMGCLAYSICVILISAKLQGIELYNKSTTAISACTLSVGGWFVWNLALSGLYDKYTPIYDVWHGFTHRFGNDALWWLTLITGVFAVLLIEVSIKATRVAFKPTATETFQVLEHDPDVRKRFEEAAADLLQQGWQHGTKKSSLEIARETEEQAQREAQVQELLERPRTLDGAPPEDGLRRRSSAHTDDDELDTMKATRQYEKDPRASIEISELFAKGFGKVKKGSELK